MSCRSAAWSWSRSRKSRQARSAAVIEDERVGGALAPDGRVWAVAGMHDRVVAEREQHARDRAHQDVVITARKIGPADRAGKEGVADEEMPSAASLAGFSDLQADAA